MKKKSDDDQLLDRMKPRLIEIIRTEVKAMLDQPDHEMDMLPAPEKKKGEKNIMVAVGKRIKFAGTVDAEVFNAFEKWRHKRGMSMSKALDVILWNHLGKPRLSFQKPEGE